MRIRKRALFEVVYPLTVVFFVCIGTSFINAMGAAQLKWVFLALLFAYLFLSKKIMVYVNNVQSVIIFLYLTWCVSTFVWSVSPVLSFSKSALFFLNVTIMISAGSLWVIKYEYMRNFDWLLIIMGVGILSGLMGGASAGSYDDYGNFKLYSGLSDNANEFGFMMAIISPIIFFKLYQYRANKLKFLIWAIMLFADFHYVLASYSRSSIAIFMCILGMFSMSLPLSKKILITLATFFCIIILLIMAPTSYLKSIIANHIAKTSTAVTIDPNSNAMLQSREDVWKKSLKQAEKGGMMGGGFAATIGESYSSKQQYRREKGNSQLAVMEETGVVGLILYSLFLISFFLYAMPCFIQLRGPEKISMGLALGAILGLLAESIVEAWWDSAAGPEMICFWSLIGMVYGMIYLQKRKLPGFSTQ